MSSLPTADPRARLRAFGLSLGFDGIGFTSFDRVAHAGEGLARYLDAGHHGDMDWMAQTFERRKHPKALWADARSAIAVAMNYGPDEDPMLALESREQGVISAYARGKDYHDIIKTKLKQLAREAAAVTGRPVKVFVDTAPLMEKPLAQAAGIGWQGKHTNLVSREFGSWLFLGAVLMAAELAPDAAESDHCGNCRRCLDVCPTDAFPAPYELDARRCIAYLTIEYKGHINEEFRSSMGNRIFGCDDCLAVCPWNKFAQVAREQRFCARIETDNPPLSELLRLDERGFRERFKGTPVKRTGRDRFLRNVLIAAGNSGDGDLVGRVARCLSDASPLVRAMAVWALARLADRGDFADQSDKFLPREKDEYVREEWVRGTKV